MELRCLPKNMDEDGLFIKWDFSKITRSKGVSLRGLMQDEKEFKKYVKDDFESFFTSL